MNENNSLDIVKSMTDSDFQAEIIENDRSNLQNKVAFPFTEMLALGAAFSPLVTSLGKALSPTTDMICRVTIPKGTHLAAFKDGTGNLGAVFNSNNQLVGQARINPLNPQAAQSAAAINPYMMVIAVALMSINRKLDDINNTQKDILAFLEMKEKAVLLGNLSFLSDVINNYKFNWNNAQYKNSNHIKVLDIKQESEQSIALFKSQIETVFERKSLFYLDKDAKDKAAKLFSRFTDYQLAVYLYAFSSYVDVLMLENFESAYLQRIEEKIQNYAFEYRERYSECYSKLENFSRGSVESLVMKGAGETGKFFGNVIKSIPMFKDSNIDKDMNENASKLEEMETRKNENIAAQLVGRQKVDVSPFIENLKTMDHLYNDPQVILFDKEKLYIA